MKRKIAAAILLVLTCFCIGNIIRKGYYRVQYSASTYVFYETTLEGLEKRVPNIVKGRIEGKPETIYSSNSSESNPIFTITSLEIVEVIKGDLKAGERIRIIEPYYIKDRVLYVYDNYLPSATGRDYFFYLGELRPESDDRPKGMAGAHFVVHQDRGRYLVPDAKRLSAQDYSRKELSLGELDTELYMRLYQEVIDAYIK